MKTRAEGLRPKGWQCFSEYGGIVPGGYCSFGCYYNYKLCAEAETHWCRGQALERNPFLWFRFLEEAA
jgi:hypothetical protein